MNCEHALEQLADYVDGQIDAPMRVVLEHHFSECASCERELSGTRELIQLFQDLPTVDPPGEFRAQLLAKIAVNPTPRPKAVWFDRWSLPLSTRRISIAGLAVAALALLFTQTSLHNANTLGWNPTLPSLKSHSRPITQASIVPELMIGGNPTHSDLVVGKTISLDVTLRPDTELHNGRMVLPRLADDAKNGFLCETYGVNTDRGLEIWRGSLNAGEPLRLPLQFRAAHPGVYHVLFHVDGDRQGQDYKRLITIPISGGTETSLENMPGSLKTTDLLDYISRNFGVVIVSDLSHEREQPVQVDRSGARLAIGRIAAQRGLQWTLSGGVYNLFESEIPVQ